MTAVHEYLASNAGPCRGCGLSRDDKAHQLPLVEISMGPLGGAIEPPQFNITIKDGTNLLARVYLSAEDFALALSGRLVKGVLAPRYYSNSRSSGGIEPKEPK